MSKNNPVKYKDIGGQAVMEGVMMQSPANESMAIAVRRPDGSNVGTCEKNEPLAKNKADGTLQALADKYSLTLA